LESESPEGMIPYALNKAVGESELLRRYEFVNWWMNPQTKEQRLICGSSLRASPSPLSPPINRASIVSGRQALGFCA
jgi:hypothetical protein